ncbi:hypothetical protein GCM10010522_37710 [Kribbella solani]
MQNRRRTHLLQRIRVRRELRIGRDQLPQLVLDRVVLRIRHHRSPPVVRIAQLHDPPRKLLNPLPNIHPQTLPAAPDIPADLKRPAQPAPK